MPVISSHHPRFVPSPLALRGAALMALLATAAACGGSDSPSQPVCAVSAVAVTAPVTQLQVGKTTTMTAAVTQANCTPTVQATWESSQPTVASVDAASGVVTAVAAGGPVTITAKAQGKSGTAQLTVTQVPVATVVVTPATGTIALGETQQLTATVRDADGAALTGRTIAWTSSDQTIATVSQTGVVTPVAPGAAAVTITATSETKTGTAALTVIAAQTANRFAYAWASDPTAAQPYTADAQYAFNATGGAITIARSSPGSYTVTFGRLAKVTGADLETVLVSAYGSSTDARCVVGGWGNTTGNTGLLVNVVCASAAGAALDSRFTILVVGGGSLPSRSGFAWANNSALAQYAPSPSYAYSSANLPISIQRQSAGVYIADLKLPRAAATDLPENYFVTAYGDATRMCKISAWGSTAGVLCYTNAGVAADAQYDILVVERGRPGKRIGFAWADQPAAATYTASLAYQRNSSGSPVTISRVSAGLYDVTFAGLAKVAGGPETVQVTSYAAGYTYCSVVNWGNSSTTNLTVRVACSNAAGVAADSYYQIMVIE
jgi:Bacterial Ig-like domain (group 2)